MGKNIVVLCDGILAGSNSRTNVYALYKELLEKKHKQHVTYINGVGNGKVPPNFIRNGAAAIILDKKIKEGYRYIVNHYNPGDDIWLFGFSNGAYIVRCIAGMIRNCGILKLDRIITPEIDKRIDLAYDIYRNRDMIYHPDGSGSYDFKKSFSYPDSEKPIIKFLGLWDTVGIHGLPGYVMESLKYLEFYDMTVSRIVNFACQALAIHENAYLLEPYRILPNSSGTVTIKETWFPGIHDEIGGGIGGNKRISKATILWIIEYIVQVGGLLMYNDIETYRVRFSPDSGPSWNIRNLLFDRKNDTIPKFMLMDRIIPLELDPSKKCLRKDLLYRDGDWLIPFDTRSRLITQYASKTYEELRKIMEKKDISLYNNIKYDKDEKELEKSRLARL
ncbi:hypothetical protein RhiirA5_470640 [Rhizophagus irregularis]|uniref:T6SS Phospholipase effector Tle1-like catalytic domain-containing protein n=1 Tax=Rhizophagus irregularis TaxID=588596 RepID=A0A2N0RUR6_9GLOM|nr:hypothetical protein RhiirA5_470640 [Rhizophagus irregularis]PKC67032.1 hypothetical protein RhiirA1_510676 [Rhizophagus irregularis]CAB4472879.1 unnamed protein product [Rhizophagus irregularis]CAB5343541.1 unnamed protein product [Rhizophagus irregularis]